MHCRGQGGAVWWQWPHLILEQLRGHVVRRADLRAGKGHGAIQHLHMGDTSTGGYEG